MQKLVVLIVSLFLALPLHAEAPDTGVVHHPEPKKPIYVSEEWYKTLKQELPHPPIKKSNKQKRDEKELHRLQKNRTEADCDAAKGEILVSLKAFYGTPGSPISDADIEKLSPFFEQLRNDADYFIQLLKKDFPRERPFLYVKGIEPCVAKEVTGAYPSGHAVLSRLFQHVLTDLYPEHKKYIKGRSKTIADHRVLVGMHHRSDIEAGQALANLIYKEFKKSDQYKKDFENAKKAIKKSEA